MAAGDSYDGRIRLIWLDTTPSNPLAITTTELGNGEDLSDYLLPDGFDPGIQNARTSGASANRSFDSEAPGRHGAQPTAMFKRKLTDGGGTVAWDTLGDRLISGVLVYFEDVDEGSDPTTGDDYQVFTGCQTLAPEPQATAVNQEKRFKVGFTVAGDVLYGTVA